MQLDYLQFISSVIGALAWPTVALIFLLVFRKEVAAIIGRIKFLRALGAEMQLEGAIADAKEVAKTMGPLLLTAEQHRAIAFETKDILPPTSVIDNYERIERAIVEVGIRPRSLSPQPAAWFLFKPGHRWRHEFSSPVCVSARARRIGWAQIDCNNSAIHRRERSTTEERCGDSSLREKVIPKLRSFATKFNCASALGLRPLDCIDL